MAILAFVFAATWFVTGAMAAHFAQAIAPPARLMRRGETVPAVLVSRAVANFLPLHDAG